MTKKRASAESAPATKKQKAALPTEADIYNDTTPFVRLHVDGAFDAKQHLKIITWNVNGLRSLLKGNDAKDFHDILALEQPDLLCLQETKLQWGDVTSAGRSNADARVLEGYNVFDSCSTQGKGYAGTRVYARKTLACRGVLCSIPSEEDEAALSFSHPYLSVEEQRTRLSHHAEGRMIALLFDSFVLVHTYVPNAGMKLERLTYRVREWDTEMEGFLRRLHDAGHAVVWTGDLNVAERDYDRYFAGSYAQMEKVPGFTPEERSSFRGMLSRLGMVDAFRALYPKAAHVYSFWSQRLGARAKNAGWRLDYFVLSQRLMHRVVDTFMMTNVRGSDHCPCVLWLRK